MASERGAMLLASMRRAVRLCVGLASLLSFAMLLSRTPRSSPFGSPSCGPICSQTVPNASLAGSGHHCGGLHSHTQLALSEWPGAASVETRCATHSVASLVI